MPLDALFAEEARAPDRHPSFRRGHPPEGSVFGSPDGHVAKGGASSGESRLRRRLGWAEAAGGIVLTLLVVYLHWVFRQHAGGLWRDEVNTVQLATLPAFAQTWDNLQFDSFPILIFGLVRGWAALFATSDASLRTLGLILGLGVFGTLWLNARLLGQRVPLVALALLGCNPLFIRYADSLRAYGLGMLLMLLTFGAVWRVVESLRPGRVALAVCLAICSVQALYYNSVLLFAMCAAGAMTAAWERDWKKALCVLGIGAPAALSLLPYAGTIHRLHEWNFLVQYPVTLGWIWKKLSDVTGAPDPIGVWVWSALFLGALTLAGWQLRQQIPAAKGPLAPAHRVLLFAAGTLVIGSMCYGLFLKALNYYTQPWYYVAYLALAATCLDAILGAAIQKHPLAAPRWRLARLAVLWAFCALMWFQARDDLFTRQTNLDLMARQLTTSTAPGDLVVNTRWECDITFARYYRGAAEVLTLPPIADHRFHRYDLVLQKMATPAAAGPVLEKMAETLRGGHRVWLIGEPMLPEAGKRLPPLQPAWKDATGWHMGGAYYGVWTMQATELLAQHADSGEKVLVPVPTPVSDFEKLPVNVFLGWH